MSLCPLRRRLFAGVSLDTFTAVSLVINSLPIPPTSSCFCTNPSRPLLLENLQMLFVSRTRQLKKVGKCSCRCPRYPGGSIKSFSPSPHAGLLSLFFIPRSLVGLSFLVFVSRGFCFGDRYAHFSHIQVYMR